MKNVTFCIQICHLLVVLSGKQNFRMNKKKSFVMYNSSCFLHYIVRYMSVICIKLKVYCPAHYFDMWFNTQ